MKTNIALPHGVPKSQVLGIEITRCDDRCIVHRCPANSIGRRIDVETSLWFVNRHNGFVAMFGGAGGIAVLERDKGVTDLARQEDVVFSGPAKLHQPQVRTCPVDPVLTFGVTGDVIGN